MFKVHFFVILKNGGNESKEREFNSLGGARAYARALRTPWKITTGGEYVEGEKFLSF